MDRVEPYTEDEIRQQTNYELLNYELMETAKTKKATIVKNEFSKTWTSRNGMMYTYLLTFDNGDKGLINSTKENPSYLQEGQELDYISSVDKFGMKFTRVKLQDPNTPSQGAYKKGQNWVDDPDKQRMIVKQSSLKAALDYYIHLNNGTAISPNEVMTLADTFTEWVIR